MRLKASGRTSVILRGMPICAVACMVVSVSVFYSIAAAFLAAALILPFAVAATRFGRMLIPLLAVCIMLTSTAFTALKVIRYESYDNQLCLLKFAVAEAPEETLYGQSVKVYSKGKTLDKNSAVILYTDSEQQLDAGKLYSAVVRLNRIENYKSYYYSENIFISASLVGNPQCIGRDTVLTAVATVRNYVKDSLYSCVSEKEAATLEALTIGEKHGFTVRFSDDVRRAGVSHVMVVSGMHLSIIMTAVFYITSFFGRNKYIRAIISLLCIAFISAVCGFTVSILRAGLMFVLMALAPLVSREGDSLNLLGLSAVIILTHSPFAVFSVSYQLSLLATYGILVFAPSIMNKIKGKLSFRLKWLTKPIGIVVVSLSATAFTLPVTVYHFEEFSLMTLLTNILISYAVTAAIVLCISALLFKLIPLIGSLCCQPLFKVSELFTKYINQVIEFCGSQKYAAVSVPRQTAFVFALPPIIAVLCMYLYRFLAYRNFLNQIKNKGVKENARDL